MHFDVPSLMLMESFVQACAGLVLVFAWWQDRRTPAVGLWGLGLIAAGVGIFATDLGGMLEQAAGYAVGGVVLTLSAGIFWRAARLLEAKPAPWWVTALGPAIVAAAGAIPFLGPVADIASFIVSVVYFGAVAVTLLQGRRERLQARVPLALLVGLQALTLALGAYDTLIGKLGPEHAPEVFSLFGIIHFESIVFALGTTAFLLMLVRERREAAMALVARTDGLTGVANRTAFVEGAERLFERCRRAAVPVAVLMFDLDHFKSVNDSHGHAAGDEVIRRFCGVATDMLRPGDLFGRMGGEEFAVVMPGVGASAAAVRAERIRAAFAEHGRVIAGLEVNSTVSCGVAASEDSAHSLAAMLDYADSALYRAKAEGRNRTEVSDRPPAASPKSNVLRVA
jgi:diguanylate cyclase (GGDEF)-like protein